MTDRSRQMEEYQSLFDVVTNREPEGIVRPFTKSNGTIMARVYERLTKRSRRQEELLYYNVGAEEAFYEKAYRRGVYETLKALQDELR